MIALYAPTLGRGLVNYEDPWLVADNWIVQQPSWASLHAIFLDTSRATRFVLGAEYLPVRDLSVMLDFALWGDWYPGFHITNLVIYLASIGLWFAVLEGFGLDRKLTGLAILFWALHPSHAESVSWLSQRKDLLGLMFAGLAGLAYVRFRVGRSASWLALAVVATLATVWSKSPFAFAIAALGALELVLPALRVSWRRSLVGLGAIALVGVSAFVPVLAVAFHNAIVSPTAHAPVGFFEMAIGLHGFYLRLAAMTLHNAATYPIIDGPSWIEIAIGAVGLACMSGVLVAPRRLRMSPALRAGAILWLSGWLPVSRLVLPLRIVQVADHYILFPTLGLALALAVGVTAIASKRARYALIIVVAVAASMRTFDAQSNWRDSRTLWERAVASNPTDGNAWSIYSESLMDAGDPQAAMEAVSAGLKRSRAPRLLMRKALLVLQYGKNRSAAEDAMRAAADGGEPRAMTNLALLYFEDRKFDAALQYARRATAIAPSYAHGHRIVGKIALATQHPDEALAAFQSAYSLAPLDLANRYNLALALIELNRRDEARPFLEACLSDPVLVDRARKALGL
ncbi:MAG: hypothetical protein JWO36_7241 [Myxococcales bacterium]|nr:hypothetical protein [Myxococcales bacterium]